MLFQSYLFEEGNIASRLECIIHHGPEDKSMCPINDTEQSDDGNLHQARHQSLSL